MRPVLPPDFLDYLDNVRLGEEGRFTRRGRDSQEDGPVDKDKSTTEAWTTWHSEELRHKLDVAA